MGSIPRAEEDEFVAGAAVGGEANRSVWAAMTILHLFDVTRGAREKQPNLSAEYLERSRIRIGIERIRTDLLVLPHCVRMVHDGRGYAGDVDQHEGGADGGP